MIEQVDRVLLPGQRVALLHCAIPLIQRTYESAVYGFETAKGRSWIGERWVVAYRVIRIY